MVVVVVGSSLGNSGVLQEKLELAGRKGRISARKKKVLSPSQKVPGALGERACALAAPTNGGSPCPPYSETAIPVLNYSKINNSGKQRKVTMWPQ